MFKLRPENIRTFIKESARANKDALGEQVGFYIESGKRNADCFTSLANAGVTSLQEMSQARSLGRVFEVNREFEARTREELQFLREETVKSWDSLRHNLKEIYSHVTESARAA